MGLRAAKIEQYERFVDERLKPDLVHAVGQRDKVLEKQRNFTELAKNITVLEETKTKSLRTMMNLGSEVYAQADVPDTSRILVDVGLGFFAEFTLQEALKFIAVKQRILAQQVEAHVQQIGNIKGQIRLVLEGIRELMNLPDDEESRMQRRGA